MRCIVEYHPSAHPPLLRLYIHGAPHRRQHIATIARYRGELVAAGWAAGLELPIAHPIDLRVTFINPCSPDLRQPHYGFVQGDGWNEPRSSDAAQRRRLG